MHFIQTEGVSEGEIEMTKTIRSEVEEFAEAMELELMKHDDRPGWKGCDPFWLLGRLNEEVKELESVLKDPNRDGKVSRVREEGADVGNFAMMITDVIKEDWLKRTSKLNLTSDFM